MPIFVSLNFDDAGMKTMSLNKNIMMKSGVATFLAFALSACSESDVASTKLADETEKDLSQSAPKNVSSTNESVKASVKLGTFVDSEFYNEYQIINQEFGTNVSVVLTDTKRVMRTNSLPQWPAKDFPEGNNSDVIEQDRTYQFPLNPVYVGNATHERSTGVSVQGIKFDAGTAQRAKCENDIEYRVEAVQGLIPFGIDAHNAHVQNDGTYHYHNIPISEIEGSELQHVGFALDGFLIYYSPKNEYPSSYQLKTQDREGVNCTYSEPDFPEITFEKTPDGTFQEDYDFVEGSGLLDKCNGVVIGGEYAYFVTDEYPHVPRCLNGQYESEGGGKGKKGGQRGHDFTTAAKKLGITEQELRTAVGGPPPNFEAAAKILGISEEKIRASF